MIRNHLSFILFVACFFAALNGRAQISNSTQNEIIADSTEHKVVVSAINVTGNKHTKTYIIEREITFKVGDSLLQKKLTATLIQARNQVYNTNLFTEDRKSVV